jgi:hypothetical protein
MRRERKRNWHLRRLVLGLAVAAIVVPTAQARIDEGTAPQAKAAGPAAVIHGDDKAIVARNPGSNVPAHDDKVILRTPDNFTASSYRRALPEDYGNRAVVPVANVHSPGSFDWGDALIGAGAAFGLMLLAGAAALGTRRGRTATA